MLGEKERITIVVVIVIIIIAATRGDHIFIDLTHDLPHFTDFQRVLHIVENELSSSQLATCYDSSSTCNNV